MKYCVAKCSKKNQQIIASSIQKDIVHACTKETTGAILIDELHDISHKEQMAFILCYVDKRGIVRERFIGIIYVTDTFALSLK